MSMSGGSIPTWRASTTQSVCSVSATARFASSKEPTSSTTGWSGNWKRKGCSRKIPISGRLMQLEIADFPVREIRLGGSYRYRSGVLEVDREDLLALVRRDERIVEASLETVAPG